MGYRYCMNNRQNHLTTVLTRPSIPVVAFDRTELGTIFKIYGKMVALGEWRDYGISMLPGVSIFSIYRRASEYPIYQVKKIPRNTNKQGIYSVIAMDGRILNRGHQLKIVLKILDAKLLRAIS